jgi:hypothetical protein
MYVGKMGSLNRYRSKNRRCVGEEKCHHLVGTGVGDMFRTKIPKNSLVGQSSYKNKKKRPRSFSRIFMVFQCGI